MGSSTSEEWRQLLQETLGMEEGAAVAASLARPRALARPRTPARPREDVIIIRSNKDVIIDITTSSKDQASSGQMCRTGTDLGTRGEAAGAANENEVQVVPVTEQEEPDSVLHVVAAAGEEEKSHLRCARMIYARASHLLTPAATNGVGDTALHCAARAGRTKMVACLIELAKGGVNGVDYDKARNLVRTRNKRGETALHEAVRSDNDEMAKHLLGADKDLAQIDAEDGTSPLYLASLLGHFNIVKLLIKNNGTTSYSGPRGQNALHAAVLHNNNRDITELLLHWNKELVSKADVCGSTPLHFAASALDPSFQFTLFLFSTRDLERCSLFFHFVVPPKWLMRLYEWFKFPLVQLLAADPTAAFQADKNGSFPVHVAAAAGCMLPLIILLIKYPGCAGLRDADGQTFLHVAAQKRRVSVVKFVGLRWKLPFSNWSVMNAQDNNGDTALHIAVRNGEQGMFRYLMRNKLVHMNLENNKGKTPMDLAAGKVKPGFYFGLSAHRRILNMLNSADALAGSYRRDKIEEYDPPMDVGTESAKIKDFAQIVGIGSVLVSTATFTAALTMPGGVWTPGDASGVRKNLAFAGTPVLNGSYAFDGFIISNTLAFICATLATFSLVYCGVSAVDIQKRIKLVSFSLALLLCSARSFCAAFAFALHLLLAKVDNGTAIAIVPILMTSFALLDALWFLVTSYVDTVAVFPRKNVVAMLGKLGGGFILNLVYLFWPYLVIFGYLFYDSSHP